MGILDQLEDSARGIAGEIGEILDFDPLKSLKTNLPNTPYNFNSFSYPENLQGIAGTGHYVNFYINVSTSSRYYSGGSYNYSSPEGSYAYSGTSASTPGGAVGSTWSDIQIVNPQETSHTRISQAISLYIPDSMNHSMSIEWESANIMEAGKQLAQGIGGRGALKAKSGAQKGGIVANTLKNVATGFFEGGGSVGQILGQYGGFAMNPQLLVLFRGIGFRTFQYDFYFTPRNQIEAGAVRNIVRAFRFHAHPELWGTYGVFYITPSTFDIEFMHKGELNKNIHKVKTCALIHYDVDYAPFGWSTYTDGMPVQTRLSLQFQELQIVTKEDIERGF